MFIDSTVVGFNFLFYSFLKNNFKLNILNLLIFFL